MRDSDDLDLLGNLAIHERAGDECVIAFQRAERAPDAPQVQIPS